VAAVVAAVVVVAVTAGRERGAVGTRHHNGQAMIELTTGMLVLILLAAVIYQLTLFVRAGHETGVRAREQAGSLAFQDYPLSVTAAYIGAVELGPDGKPYTRDDEFLAADPGTYYRGILDPLTGEPTDWNALETVPGNAFSELRGSSSPISIFGLLRGEDSEDVDLLPGVQHLLYRADHIRIEETVWMPWTRGVY